MGRREIKGVKEKCNKRQMDTERQRDGTDGVKDREYENG